MLKNTGLVLRLVSVNTPAFASTHNAPAERGNQAELTWVAKIVYLPAGHPFQYSSGLI